MNEENLKDKSIKLSDVSILSAHDIDDSLLLDFYNIIYPGRRNSFIWKWLNRSSFYNNKIPLVILYDGRVIAHAGMIPFNVYLDGKYYTASWFMDFAVLPQFQRCGLGALLTERWMEFSDLYVTFCNEKSMDLFKKYGWVESFDTYLHRYLLMPFDRPRFINSMPLFIRKILNTVSLPFLNGAYRKYAFHVNNIRFDDLNSNSLARLETSLNMPSNAVVPIRDSDYISWRLLGSPEKDKYRVFSMKEVNDISIIIKMCNKNNLKYIDLLWISNLHKYDAIRHMISTLALWGINENYFCINAYTSDKNLSNYLKESLKPIVTHPRFAFYTRDTALLEKLKHSDWHWELIDSDFEWI